MKEWQSPNTTRTYLHPPKSERIITLWREGKLLQSNLYTVSQVAQMLGYSDTTYFCKVFKKENGISPKAFGAREE